MPASECSTPFLPTSTKFTNSPTSTPFQSASRIRRSLPLYLSLNRVPVATLDFAAHLADSGGSQAFTRFFRDEVDRHDRQLDAYTEVVSAWRREGIQSVLVKSTGSLPYTSSNLDVLVSSECSLSA